MFDNVYQFFRVNPPWEVIVELAVIWGAVYLAFRFLLGTRGAGVAQGLVAVLVVFTLLIKVVGDQFEIFLRLRHLYDTLLNLLAILLIVVFAPELREAMVRLSELLARRGEASDPLLKPITEAIEYLARNQFGALIVIERSGRLGGIINSGTALDARVSAALLECIFYPNSPLHDLAVVIRGDRIVAASVQLPLAENAAIPQHLGSRHRAGLGITMDSDCLVVIVSEETGEVRFAERGQLSTPVPRDQVRARLAERLHASADEGTADAAAVTTAAGAAGDDHDAGAKTGAGGAEPGQAAAPEITRRS